MNALFNKKIDRRTVHLPWSTYTDPEIAHVGKYPSQLDSDGVQYDTYLKSFDKLDRAICEGKKGFVKIHTEKGSDKIIGATVVGGPAGELISIITNGMFNGIGLEGIGKCVYPYPTYAEAIKHLANECTQTLIRGGVHVARKI